MASRRADSLTVCTISTVSGGAEAPDSAKPVAVSLPSRYIPVFGLFTASVSIFGSVILNRWYGHDIGGIPWPYISDTAKDSPQAGMFAYGMTVTSCVIVWNVVINYGKIKNDCEVTYPDPTDTKISSRNRLGLIAGLLAAPNLGLLASFDTKRDPELHLLFVLLFFLPCIVYLFVVKSVYELLLVRAEVQGNKKDDDSVSRPSKSYLSLRTSLRFKRIICTVFLLAVSFYLPIGMSLVSDWQDYSNDVTIHTSRAVAQHVSVFCLCAFFATMYFDFGDMEFYIVQG